MIKLGTLPLILVPFGVEQWSFADIRITGGTARGLRLEAPFPCALIDPRANAPHRLNSAGLGRPNASGEGEDAFAALGDRIKALCDPWNKSARAFVEAYLDAAARLAGLNAPAARGEGAAALYQARDWVYSAPFPLPRAHLHAPAEEGERSKEDPSLRVDFAFWTGHRFVAVDAEPPALLPRAAERRRQRLRHAGITLVEQPPDAAGFEDFFALLMADHGMAFWQEEIPLGPFPSRALEALDDMVRA